MQRKKIAVSLIAVKQILGWSDAISNMERMTKEYQWGQEMQKSHSKGIF